MTYLLRHFCDVIFRCTRNKYAMSGNKTLKCLCIVDVIMKKCIFYGLLTSDGTGETKDLDLHVDLAYSCY